MRKAKEVPNFKAVNLSKAGDRDQGSGAGVRKTEKTNKSRPGVGFG
jgi:hypothetical protein